MERFNETDKKKTHGERQKSKLTAATSFQNINEIHLQFSQIKSLADVFSN
jgi:hypothetical protein